MGHDDTRVYSGGATSRESQRAMREHAKGGADFHVGNRGEASQNPATPCKTQGAMSLQSHDAAHGHESVPQKLLHLVGHRDPRAWRRSGTG